VGWAYQGRFSSLASDIREHHPYSVYRQSGSQGHNGTLLIRAYVALDFAAQIK
jgi:hypothetical protein